MNFTHVRTLARAALRSGRYLLGGDVRFPQHRLGSMLETDDGRYVVYRETELRSAVADTSTDRVVLVFRMQVTLPGAGESVREVLFDPLANVATPFFVGMPGFERKLWLAGDRSGEFLELYEWATAEDARRFVEVLEALLDPFDFAGSASFDVVADDSIDGYVASREVRWREGDDARRRGGKRRRRARTLALLALVLVVGYLVRRRTARDDSRG